MNNYRPISLIIGFSKILQMVMTNRLNQHLPEQFGFRKGITIQQTIFTLTDYILSALNKWQKAGGIFCDLSKAFYCIRHNILTDKLNHFGAHGTNLNGFNLILLRGDRV